MLEEGGQKVFVLDAVLLRKHMLLPGPQKQYRYVEYSLRGKKTKLYKSCSKLSLVFSYHICLNTKPYLEQT